MAERDNSGRWIKGGASPNPSGRKKRTDTGRVDGWYNTLTGVGMATKDKSVSTAFQADLITPETAVEIWRGDDLAARIIETLPNEMLRQGFELKVAAATEPAAEDGPERYDAPVADDPSMLVEAISGRWEDLELQTALWEALAYERAYGGGAILLGVNDGQAPDRPLALERVRSLDWLTVLEPRELVPSAWYGDPQAAKFGKVARYQLNPVGPGGLSVNGDVRQAIEVHESRLVVFGGIKVTRRNIVSASGTGWGDSVLSRCYRILRDYNVSWTAASVLIHDFSQAVYKIKGLAELFGQNASSAILSRLESLELSRSVIRGVLLDAEESFERQGTPITGLPDLLDRFSNRLAAAADMPVTLLMGQSPGGLNATGDSDIRFFYDRVRSMQDRKLRPAIEKVCKILFRTMGQEPDSWSICFKPLWQPTEKEQAETRLIQAQVDKVYIEQDVLSADEVAVNRFSTDEFNFSTQVNFEARAALEVAAAKPVQKAGEDPDEAPEPELVPPDAPVA